MLNPGGARGSRAHANQLPQGNMMNQIGGMGMNMNMGHINMSGLGHGHHAVNKHHGGHGMSGAMAMGNMGTTQADE
jgi:hypothetical protein